MYIPNDIINTAAAAYKPDALATARASGKPDEILGALTRDQWQHYLDQFGPLEDQLIDSVDSTALVDRARKDATIQSGVSKASLDRTMSRYGIGGLGSSAPALVQRQLARRQSLGAATAAAQGVNDARLDQRERNLGVASGLMQMGRGVAAQGIGGMGDAAGMAANREAQYQNAKSAHKQQQYGTMASLGSAALTAAILL